MNWRHATLPCASLALLALGACVNADTEPQSLTDAERAALKLPQAGEFYEPTADKVTLFNTLNDNLRTWNDTAAKQMGEDLRLRSQLGSILTRQVSWNFDTILEELLVGSRRNRVIAAAALGFTPTTTTDGKEPRSKRAVSALLGVLDEGEDELTQNAVLALQQIADPDTPREPIFKLLLNHHNPAVRANAALAAAKLIRPDEASRWLAELSAAYNSDDEPKVKLHVVKALGNTKHHDAAFVLTRALNDKNTTVQAAAADAIGNLGFPEMCRYLVEKLDSGVGAVRHYAHDALCRLAGKDYGTKQEDWQEWCSTRKK